MGSSYTNIQVRSRDFERVVDSLRKTSTLPSYVSKPCDRGWISVYPRATESQDPKILRSIAESLSRDLETGVFGLLVHDSDLFFYVLFEEGRLADEYDSDPGYFDGSNVAPSGGNMQAVARYCLPGTTIKELSESFAKKPNKTVETAKFVWHMMRKDFDKAFNSASVFRGDALARTFGEKLGLSDQRITVGYKYLKRGEGDVTKLVLLRNENDDLQKINAPSMPPNLMTENQFQLTQVTDAALRAHFERAEQQSETIKVGEELNWFGSIHNAGGSSTGIRFTIESSDFDERLFSSVTASVERWQSSSHDDSDEEGDSETDELQPHVFSPKATAPGVWSYELADFFFSREMLIRLPLIASKTGKTSLKVSVKPLAIDGSSTAEFKIDLNVRA